MKLFFVFWWDGPKTSKITGYYAGNVLTLTTMSGIKVSVCKSWTWQSGQHCNLTSCWRKHHGLTSWNRRNKMWVKYYSYMRDIKRYLFQSYLYNHVLCKTRFKSGCQQTCAPYENTRINIFLVTMEQCESIFKTFYFILFLCRLGSKKLFNY